MNVIKKDELYESILKKPLEQGADRLCVLSGYVTPNFVEEYLNSIPKENTIFHLQVVQGMARSQGISRQDHAKFLSLENTDNFEIYYYTGSLNRIQSVHAKVYIWLKGNEPLRAFIGSANFTNQGFNNEWERTEMMTQTNAEQAYQIFLDILDESKSVRDPNIGTYITLESYKSDPCKIEKNTQYLKVPLVIRGKVYQKSGLNLGFAGKGSTKNRRSRDVAAIRIDASMDSFFPVPEDLFTVITDDGMKFTMKRTKKGKRRLTLDKDQKNLGLYFRRRLDIMPGVAITKKHLDKYGRTDLEFEKDEAGIYYLDFSPPIDSFDTLWDVIFRAAAGGLEVWSKNGKVKYKIGINEDKIIVSKLATSVKSDHSKEQTRCLWNSMILTEQGIRRDPKNVLTKEIGRALNYAENRRVNSYWWVIYNELYNRYIELF